MCIETSCVTECVRAVVCSNKSCSHVYILGQPEAKYLCEGHRIHLISWKWSHAKLNLKIETMQSSKSTWHTSSVCSLSGFWIQLKRSWNPTNISTRMPLSCLRWRWQLVGTRLISSFCTLGTWSIVLLMVETLSEHFYRSTGTGTVVWSCISALPTGGSHSGLCP